MKFRDLEISDFFAFADVDESEICLKTKKGFIRFNTSRETVIMSTRPRFKSVIKLNLPDNITTRLTQMAGR